MIHFGISNDERDFYPCEKCEIPSISEDDLLEYINSKHYNAKKEVFGLDCLENVNEDPEYKVWQKEVTQIPLVTFESVEEKEIHDDIF